MASRLAHRVIHAKSIDFAALRRELELPEQFPPAAQAQAETAAKQVTLPALEIAPPSIFWGAKEIAIDALHHAVYAAATGAAYAAITA